MRAVNLIPDDARRGGGAGGIGRSGGAAYALLGGLAVMVALVAAWAFTGRTVSRDRAEVQMLKSQVAALQARATAQHPAAAAAPAVSAQERLAAVRSLVTGRTDWSRTLDAVARTLPADTSLSALTAAASPGDAAGGAGNAGAVASSSAGPSIRISGCSPSQKAVAKLMPRLRVVPGVQTVSLVSSTQATTGASTGSGTSSSCSGFNFELVLFLEPKPAPAAPAAAAGTAPAAAPGATQ